MRAYLSERNLVVVLFVLVLITFSLAQEDSKKMEQLYSGTSVNALSKSLALKQDNVQNVPQNAPVQTTPAQ